MADKKIPAPSSEAQLAWSRAGVGDWNLVFDPLQQKWRVVKRNEVAPYQITMDEYKGGENTYAPRDTAKVGTGVPEDVKQRQAVSNDPLAPYVEKFGLRVVTDPTNGRTYLEGFTVDKNGKRGQEGVPFFLYLDSKGKINLSEDYDAVKSAAIKDLKDTGRLNNLFQEFYNKKLISKEVFESKNINSSEFNAALVGTLGEYSKSVIGNRQFDPTQTQAPDFFNFLQTSIRGQGGVDESDLPRREFQDIGKAELNAFIDNIYLETLGRKPTEEQRKAKLKELNKIVRQGVLTSKKVVGGEVQYRTTGGFNQEREELKLQEQLRQENPMEYERRQAFGFMDELQKIMAGGM